MNFITTFTETPVADPYSHPSSGGMLQFAPPDIRNLYMSYMPFVQRGGVYVGVSGTKRYELGAEVLLMVKLPSSEDRTPAVGKVVLINRSSSVARPSGVGIQFADSPENAALRDRIETLLAGMSHELTTFTM
jgi:type IV pilus assembly protein PilZ